MADSEMLVVISWIRCCVADSTVFALSRRCADSNSVVGWLVSVLVVIVGGLIGSSPACLILDLSVVICCLADILAPAFFSPAFRWLFCVGYKGLVG